MPGAKVAVGGVLVLRIHAWLWSYDHRPLHPYNAGEGGGEGGLDFARSSPILRFPSGLGNIT